jgi:hypothetical protein
MSLKAISTITFLFVTLFSFAQDKTKPPVDKSPLDISFFPDVYPILKIQDKAPEPLCARVIYSRPQKNGRDVFGNLVEYGQIWRLGANEATEIEFYRDAKIANKTIKKGRYTLYAIPNVDKWTIIVNQDTDTWGAFKYDQKKDIVRVEVTPEKNPEPIEFYSMYFEKINKGANLVIQWDIAKASLPILFN